MHRSFIIAFVFMITAGMAFAQSDLQKQLEDKKLQESYLYQWTDDRGVVHITDGLGKVPTKYRDKAVKLDSSKQDEAVQGQQLSQPSDSHDEQGLSEDSKEKWKQRMKAAQERLVFAQRRYQELDQKRNEALMKWGGVASGHLENKLEAQRIEDQMKQTQQEIDNARNEIEVAIPEAARKAGIPPGWLRE